MAIFNKHEGCRGITLFKLGARRVELWFCPAGYAIEEHSHPKEDIELMYLFGDTLFFRRNLAKPEKVEWERMTWKRFGAKFSVRYFHSHWFTVGRLPLVFLNFQKFREGFKPESAAKDFEVTNINQILSWRSGKPLDHHESQ